MTRILPSFLLPLAVLAVAVFPAAGRTARTVQVEGGGTGPYKAVIVEDDELPGYSIFRPADLKSAAAVEGPLPIILFGNGAQFGGFLQLPDGTGIPRLCHHIQRRLD